MSPIPSIKNVSSDQELSPQALERLISVLSQARHGDFSGRLKASDEGVEGEVADGINIVLSFCGKFSEELERVAKSVTQGDLGVRVALDNAKGQWAKQTQSVNEIISLFARHTAETYAMIKALHAGDLNKSVATGPETINSGGDLLQLANELNGTFSHLKSITAEVINILAQVGLDGNLRYQRQITDAMGSWGVLVGGLHAATGSLSEQVQELCEVAQALAAGRLSTRAAQGMHGDLHAVKVGLNSAAESMAAYCAEMRRVAHAVTTEGTINAELRHPDPRGEWQSAQDACNHLLSTLSSTIRHAAVTIKRILEGEYQQDPAPPLPGELAILTQYLKELAIQQDRTDRTIQMLIHGRFSEVRLSEESARDQALTALAFRVKSDWFRAARVGLFEARRQHRNKLDFVDAALRELFETTGAVIGALYEVRGDSTLSLLYSLGGNRDAGHGAAAIAFGEGLVGKAALTRQAIVVDDLESSSIRARTGLLEIVPRSALLFPIAIDQKVAAVLELAFTGNQAIIGLELLRTLHEDLAEGLREVNSRALKPEGDSPILLREIQDELLIANARLEHTQKEMSLRESQVRMLQTEIDALRGRLKESAR